jgi:hypothetical protein
MPTLQSHPCPKGGIKRPATDTAYTWEGDKPTGGSYSPGRKHGSARWVPMHAGCDVKPNVAGHAGALIVNMYDGWVEDLGVVWDVSAGGYFYGHAQVLMRHRYKRKSGLIVDRWSFHAHGFNLVEGLRRGRKVDAGEPLVHMGAEGTVENVHDHTTWQSTPRHKDGVIDIATEIERLRRKRLRAA